LRSLRLERDLRAIWLISFDLLSGDSPASTGHGHSPAPLGSGIGFGPLASNRQSSAVPQATVGSNVDQSTDIAVYLAAQVTFNHFLAVNDLTNSSQIGFAEVADARVINNACRLHDIFGLRRADAEDAPQSDFDALVVWNVDSRDYCHVSPSACGPVILAFVYAWGFRK